MCVFYGIIWRTLSRNLIHRYAELYYEICTIIPVQFCLRFKSSITTLKINATMWLSVYPVKEVCLWPEAFHQIFQFCREIIPVTWATVIATSSLPIFIRGKKFSKQNYEPLKILAARRITWRKFHTVCLLIIGTTAGNLIFGKNSYFPMGFP